MLLTLAASGELFDSAPVKLDTPVLIFFSFARVNFGYEANQVMSYFGDTNKLVFDV